MQALKIWEYDDVFNPVTDLNDNFSKTKDAIDALELTSGSDTTRIETLEAQNGSETLTTTAQTLSGAVNELDADINTPITGLSAKVQTAQTDITSLKMQNGQEVLQTTAQTLSGAVNELKTATDANTSDINTVGTGLKARCTALEAKTRELTPTDVTGTLAAGNTSLVLTDASIGDDSFIDFYLEPFTDGLTNAVQSGTSVTLTFEAQASDISVTLKVYND